MRLLLVHNYYRMRGGEDQVFEAEADLLRTHGHEVAEHTEHNARVAGSPRDAARAIWSGASLRAIARRLDETRPALAHFHNTFPLVSPSGYFACRRAGVPVVQTLHNYRLICPAATLFRDGGLCDECPSARVPWPAVAHACYRGSRAQSAAAAAMLTVHRVLRTWAAAVDVFIAPSEFVRTRLVRGGLPGETILVKPHFVHPDPGERKGPGEYALFVGRLSEEKGIRPLLRAWRELRGVPLVVVGDGPLRGEVEAAAASAPGITVLGPRPPGEVAVIMKGARFLVFPSIWFEPFGRVIIEAFACGLPVVAASAGAAAELVSHEDTGLHFTAGAASDLAARAAWLWAHPRAAQAMGRRARREFEDKYGADANLRRLLDIYETAAAAGSAGRRRSRR